MAYNTLMKERSAVCRVHALFDSKDWLKKYSYSRGMRNLQLVVVAAFALSILETGVSQCDGEKYKYDCRFPIYTRSLVCVSLVSESANTKGCLEALYKYVKLFIAVHFSQL